MSDAHPEQDQSISGEISALGPWFHNLHLPGGEQTAPDHVLGDSPRCKWLSIAPHVAEDLSGWTVLDIGCNAGFYSFELARRGARVTGIDRDAANPAQARWAARRTGLEHMVDFRLLQVHDLFHVRGRWDLVLFMGVLYHLRYPLLALDILHERTGRLLLFQSLTMPGEEVVGETDGFGIDLATCCCSPDGPRRASSSTASRATRPTGGFPTTPPPRRCCARRASRYSRGPRGRSLARPDAEHPPCTAGWNREELLAACGARPKPA